MNNSDLSSQFLANRLTQWARGEMATPLRPSVILVPKSQAGWVADSGNDLIDEGTLVLVRTQRGEDVLTHPVGKWISYQGEIEQPGDEIQVGKDFWLQTVDYQSLRFTTIAGPTVARLLDATDVTIFANDASGLRIKGDIDLMLVHPGVEIGDRCLLSGNPCTAGGHLSRLYVSENGNVRTVPSGLVLGQVGDTRETLARNAAVIADEGIDPCGSEEVSAALSKVNVGARRTFLNILDAIRTMQLRTGKAWFVSGVHGRVAYADPTGDVFAPREDLLMLWIDSQFVLFDTRQRRGFTIGSEAAEAFDVLLHASTESDVLERLSMRSTIEGMPHEIVRVLQQTLDDIGVPFAYVTPT